MNRGRTATLSASAVALIVGCESMAKDQIAYLKKATGAAGGE